MAGQVVAVFGGTGFLGRRVAGHLLSQGFEARIASRSPSRLPPAEGLQWMGADINDEGQVAAAVAGAYGVVNAVSLYRERGTAAFGLRSGCSSVRCR
ncbi:MAG: NAD(P)H-binding protein [Rhodomicrobium sp.]